MKILVYSILLLVVILPENSFAFKFDKWKSGTSATTVLKMCKKYNYDCKQRGNSVDLGNGVRYKTITYDAGLLNHKATVKLYFTHKSKILFMSNVSWLGLNDQDSKALFKVLHTTLEKKYRYLHKSKSKSMLIMKGQKCEGSHSSYLSNKFGDRIKVGLSSCFNHLTVDYIDKMLQKTHNKEAKKANKPNSNDLSKF